MATNEKKLLTLEDAVLEHTLAPQNRYVAWQGKDDKFTYIEDNDLVQISVSKKSKKTLLTLGELNMILSTDLNGWPLFSWKNESTLIIFRQRIHTEIDVKKKQITQRIILPSRISNEEFNGYDIYAYTKGNNLFFCYKNGKEFVITDDKESHIINGQPVSRNEFGISKGIFWSPNGKKIAFFRKDESRVGTFPLLNISTRTGTLQEIKYPMAGTASEIVSVGVFDVTTKKTVFIKASDFDNERYLTNVTWGPNSDKLYIQVLNRTQKEMHLNRYNAVNGSFERTLFVEKNDKYVEPLNPIVFLSENPSQFIYRTNNRNGYFSLYLHDTSGKLIRHLTPVNADVAFAGENGKNVFYTSAEVSPIENHLFRTPLKKFKATQLTSESSWHEVAMSANGKYFIDTYSKTDTPKVVQLSSGKKKYTIYAAPDPMADYRLGDISIGTLKSADGQFDNYYRLVKPLDFKASQKYPLLVYVYGGPHSQLVRNTWQANLRRWELYMAQRGFVVFTMDNRGTQNRGAEYEKAIYGQCGQAEMADQMAGIQWLCTQPWIDKNRIGIHGWSYGGFMALSLATTFPGTFSVAVAGGPVVDWKWYEVMYGERYMDTPQNNPEGYKLSSLIPKASQLKAHTLICQGSMDKVVLQQHSLNFVQECIKNNIHVDYFPFPCADHHVKGRDKIYLMQKVTDYIEHYLK